MPLFPLLLAVHILLAVSLFLPSLLLPFALRPREAGTSEHGPFVRALLGFQRRGSGPVAVGLAVTGLGLVFVLGADLLAQPWLLAALGLYVANLALAAAVQRPALRRLFGMRGPLTDSQRAAWAERARRQRYVSYLMAGLVGAIGFLMTTKPKLW